MYYNNFYTAGRVSNGAHLTGSMEFYTIKTLVPVADEVVRSGVVETEEEVKLHQLCAGDNFRMLCDLLSAKGEPVIQSIKVEKKDVAGEGFGEGFSGEMEIHTYNFSLEQPKVWGAEAEVAVENLKAAIFGKKVPFVAEGTEETLGEFNADNTVVEYRNTL